MTIALLLSALTMAAAVASGPIVKDGVEITVLPQIGVAGAPGAVTEVGLDIEAKTADAAARLGFQSLHAIADVDCAKAANRFINAEAYDQPGLAGPGRQRNVTGQWVQPSSDSYMSAVIGRVCAAPATVAAAARTRPLPVVREMAAAASPPARASQAPAPAPTAAPQVAAPQAAPPPTPPQVVKFSGGAPVAAPLAAAAPRPAPAPPPAAAPQAAPPPSAPAQSPPLVVRFNAQAGAPPAATAAPRTVATAPRVAGDRVAQVAASSNVHDAEKVLRELRPLIAAPLTTTIEQAVVGGDHVFRADVVGFSSAADAKAFCKSAAEVSKTCWVRAKDDTAAPAKPPAKPPEHLRPAKPGG